MAKRHQEPQPDPAVEAPVGPEQLKRLYLRPLSSDGLERLAAGAGWEEKGSRNLLCGETVPGTLPPLDAIEFLATNPAVTPEAVAGWVRELGYRFTMTDALEPIFVNLHGVGESGACAVVLAGNQRVEVPTDAREDQPHWFMKIVVVRVLVALGVPADAIAIELTRPRAERDRRADVYAHRRSLVPPKPDLWFECGMLDVARREEIQAQPGVTLVRVIRAEWLDRWNGRRVSYQQILAGHVPPHDVMRDVIAHNREDLVPRGGQLWVVDVNGPMPALVVAVRGGPDHYEWMPGDRPMALSVTDADGPTEWEL